MTASSHTTGEAFALDLLRDHPNLDYASVQRAANEAGVTLQPIQFGRARRQLGLTGPAPTAAPAAEVVRAPAPRVDDETDGDAKAGEATDDDSGTDDTGTAPQAADMPQATNAPKAERKAASPAFEWLLDSLRTDATLSYGELKMRAEPHGYSIAPIMYGRAKALLGLVPVRPRGAGKQKQAAASASAPRPASTPTAARSSLLLDSAAGDTIGKRLAQVGNIDDLVKIVRELEAERRSLRNLLEQIANTIDEALGYSD